MNVLTRSALTVALIQALGIQPVMADADMDRYASSKYQYCDAVMLAAVWHESVGEAKARIGRKIGWNSADIVESDLGIARGRGVRCGFQDSGFVYDDAEAVAQLWGTSIEVAKASLAEKVSLGDRTLADEVISEAYAAQHARNARPSRPASGHIQNNNFSAADADRYFGIYANSEYGYCDAVVLSNYWGSSVYDAKTTIGLKLGNNVGHVIEENLDLARRNGDRCEFADTGFEYADAKVLAKYWRVSVSEAKHSLAEKVSLGSREIAIDALRDAYGATGKQGSRQ